MKLKRFEKLKPWIEGQKVLHIGCVQHSSLRTSSNNWIHSYIVKHADAVLGIDILDEEIKALQESGYNVQTADAEIFDLDTTFDVIFAGELIEHLDNPGRFLNRCKKHMEAESKLVISTPNSFGIIYFCARFLGLKFVNQQHTCWFDENTLEQLLTRHNLKLVERYFLPVDSSNLTKAQNTILRIIESLFPKRFRSTLFAICQLSSDETATKPINICAVIPAYNESPTIGKVIKQTKNFIETVFVVNNGSTDDTDEIARSYGAQVIEYSDKHGYGAAQYAGQQAALNAGFDYILQLDADGQHNPDSIPDLIKAAQTRKYDIVIGSRFLGRDRKQLHNVRKAGIIFFSRLVSFIGHTKITDVTSGFKIYKASTLRRLSKPSDINPAVEQMLEIAKKGMTIKEIEIETLGRSNGESHLNLLKFAIYPLRALWLITKVMLFK